MPPVWSCDALISIAYIEGHGLLLSIALLAAVVVLVAATAVPMGASPGNVRYPT
ncbi:MAG: hypothetical protein ACXU9D_06720 [Xanthobacteraceae bacterium]